MNRWIFIATLTLGAILFLAGGVLRWAVIPAIIRTQVKDKIELRNGTESFDRFVMRPVPIHFGVTFFQLENAEEFDASNRSDTGMLRFTPIGPYVYDEIREKTNISFDGDSRVEFYERKQYIFNQNLTDPKLHADDKIRVVNPLFTAKFFHGSGYDGFTSIAFTDEMHNIAVKGSDGLAGKSLFGPENKVADEATTMNTGTKDIDLITQYELFDKKPELTIWKPNSTCNELRGTEGTQFKPSITSSDTLYAFEPMLCKTIKFVSDESIASSGSLRGIDYVRFYASDENFAHIIENDCYCFEEDKTLCLPDLLSLSKCGAAVGMDIWASSPYFQPVTAMDRKAYPGIPKLKSPLPLSYENYGSILDIEPITGTVIRAHKRVQLNLRLIKGALPFLANLSETYNYVPLAWVEEAGEIDEENANKLLDQAIRPKALAENLSLAAFIVGAVLLLIGAGCAYFTLR